MGAVLKVNEEIQDMAVCCGKAEKIAQNRLKIRLTYEVEHPKNREKVGGEQTEVASDFKISH